MTPEKEVQNAIINYFKKLNDCGIKNYVERRQAGGFSYKMGLPDLWVTIFGKHIEIEVKRPNEKARTTQQKWATRFKDMGVIYLCTDSIIDVINLIEMLSVEYFNTKKGGEI